LSAEIHPTLLVNATFTYPPFEALPLNTPYYEETPKKTGNCSVQHFFEYNVSTTADLTVGAALSLKNIISKNWSMVPWELPEKMIATGCHIPAGNFVNNFQKLGNSIVKTSEKILNTVNGKLGTLKVLSIDVDPTGNSSGYLFITIMYESGAKRQAANNSDTTALQSALVDAFGVSPNQITVTTDPAKPGVATARVETGNPAISENPNPSTTSSPSNPATTSAPSNPNTNTSEGAVSASGDSPGLGGFFDTLKWYYTLLIGAALMALVCLVIGAIVFIVKKVKKQPEEERV